MCVDSNELKRTRTKSMRHSIERIKQLNERINLRLNVNDAASVEHVWLQVGVFNISYVRE